MSFSFTNPFGLSQSEVDGVASLTRSTGRVRKARRKKDKKPVTAESVRKMVSSTEEIKQNLDAVNTPAAALASTQAGTFRMINVIAQGTAQGQRVGNKIRLVRLDICASYANGSVVGPAIFRFVVFRDMQASGALATNAQLMRDVTAASNFNSPFNIDNRKRFRILHDMSYPCNNDGGATDQACLHTLRITKRFGKNEYIQYNNLGTGLIADVSSGNIIVAAYTDAAAGQPFIAFDSALYYTDA